MQSEISELRTRAAQFDEHARILQVLIERAEEPGNYGRGSKEHGALHAAVASLSIRAAQARYDAKQLEAVEAELTRAGQ